MPLVDEETEVNFKIHCHATDALLLADAVKMKLDQTPKTDPNYEKLSGFYGLFENVAGICVQS